MEEGSRKILSFKVKSGNLLEFMDEKKPLIMSEVLSAAEELVYKELEVIDVCNITLNSPFGSTTVNCKLLKGDLDEGLNKLMDWTLETEEYEMSHRVKLLREYIENDNRSKTKRRVRKAKSNDSKSAGREKN